jgi:hypothetical protein
MPATEVTVAVGGGHARSRAPLVALILLDGLVCGASGLVLVAAAWLLDDVLGVSPLFLLVLGLVLVAYAFVLALLARRGAPAAGVKAVIAANTLWAVASVVAVVADWLTLTTAGTVLVLLQAGAVAVMAELQVRRLRRLG